MMQLIFFAVSVLVLLFGHFLFGLAFVKLFQINTFEGKITVAFIILFLFLSVVIASYAIHKWDNLFTRWYYILAGFWIGFLVNCSLMFFGAFILKLVAGGQWPISLLVLKFLILGGALALSIFGLYKAWFPKVTTYDVFIKDLPASWENKVVVQISDVHLGPVYRKISFGRLLDKVQTLNPEAVFITGDLFDGMESDFSWLNHPFSKLQIPRGIYYSFGNHDLYLGFDRVIELLKGNPVNILDNKMVTVDGLQIIGINYSFNKDFDLQAAILDQVGYRKEQPSILLFHEPKNIDLAMASEIDLQLSGHTHRGQIFPFNYIARLAYRGFGYGLFTKDDFSLIVSSGSGTWGPAMRTSGQSEIVKIILHKK